MQLTHLCVVEFHLFLVDPAFTDNSFASLVFTPELCLFSIACHFWTHTSFSVGPFFQILWITWISNHRLLINSALFHIGKHYFIYSVSLLQAASVSLECSPLLISSYPTKLWPVQLINLEMSHQLVSFTFHNFYSLFHRFPTVLHKCRLRIQMDVQLLKEQKIVQFHHLLFCFWAIFI